MQRCEQELHAQGEATLARLNTEFQLIIYLPINLCTLDHASIITTPNSFDNNTLPFFYTQCREKVTVAPMTPLSPHRALWD